jgi:hypothetical protein
MFNRFSHIVWGHFGFGDNSTLLYLPGRPAGNGSGSRQTWFYDLMVNHVGRNPVDIRAVRIYRHYSVRLSKVMAIGKNPDGWTIAHGRKVQARTIVADTGFKGLQ